MEKKGGGLRPCLDFQELNQITVKYPYPLPLVSSALEQLREVVFQSAYNLSESANEMNGKQLLAPPMATTNIWSCCMGSRQHPNLPVDVGSVEVVFT